MIILDPPYISKEFKNYLISRHISVLKNDTALQALGTEAPYYRSEDRLQVFASGQQVSACSENSIDWIMQNTKNQTLHSNIESMKNSFAFFL